MKPISEMTNAELTSDLALVEQRRNAMRRELFKRNKDSGQPIYENGYWVGKVQTIRQEIPSPLQVARCLPTLINENQWPEYLKHFFDRISITSWPGAVKGLPVAAELMAMLDVSDEDGGMIEVIGKPTSTIVKYIPNTGRREGTQHIVTMDDPPLEAKPLTSFEDEDGAIEMADMSAGD